MGGYKLRKKIWIIKKEEMKTKKALIVPLCNTVLEVIQKMKNANTSLNDYVFPSRLSKTKKLSENTLNFSLKRMGFNVTAHGFRHTASTLLHENIHKHNFRSELIEIQLSHTIGSSVQQVYNKALYLEERIKLMEWWGAFLDDLKSNTN